MEMEKILKRVQEDSVGTEDITLNCNEYYMDSTNKIHILGTNLSYDLTDWAFSQACNSLGMPARYEKKLAGRMPAMVQQQFNYWKNELNKDVLLRTKDNNIRGFLSTGYAPYNNENLVEQLHSMGNSYGDPIACCLNDHIFHLRFVDSSEEYDAGQTVHQVGDILQKGVDVLNSEVGACSVVVTPMVYRLVCTNGLRTWSRDEDFTGETKFRHYKKSEADFQALVEKSMEEALKKNGKMAERFITAKNFALDADPNKIIEDLLKKDKATQKTIQRAKEEFLLEPEMNMYGIINSITAAAKGFEKIEDRVHLESYAGKVLASL